MAERFSEQTIAQIPHIPGPHTLYQISIHQLAEYRLYSIAVAADHRASLRPALRRNLFELCLKVQILPGQFIFESWAPVVSVAQYGSAVSVDQLRRHSGLMDIGRSYAEADDDTRPSHQRVQSKAVEGLSRDGIVSETSLSSEPLTSVCAGELTDRDSETVNEFQRGVVSDLFDQTLPYYLLDTPQIRCLSDKCGAMYPCHCREEMRIVSAKVAVDGPVLVEG